MVALFAQIRAKVSPTQDEQKNGFLVVPADVSEQEFIEEEEAGGRTAKSGRQRDWLGVSNVNFSTNPGEEDSRGLRIARHGSAIC